MAQLKITVVTPPAVEPATLDELKSHLRIDHVDEDVWLRNALEEARERVEGYLGRALITQTLERALDWQPQGTVIELPRPPLQSVTSVTFYDEDDAATVVDSGEYVVDTRSTPGRVTLKAASTWPALTERRVSNCVIVRYVAGYGDEAAAVPRRVRQAVLMYAADRYENREATAATGALLELPYSVERSLSGLRVGPDRSWLG